MPDFAESKETIDEAIDRAKAAGADLLVDAKKVMDGSLNSVEAIVREVLDRIEHFADSLDGYTATITIPPITIRLHKEQGQ